MFLDLIMFGRRFKLLVTHDPILSGDEENNANIEAQFSKRTMHLVQIEFYSRGGLWGWGWLAEGEYYNRIGFYSN